MKPGNPPFSLWTKVSESVFPNEDNNFDYVCTLAKMRINVNDVCVTHTTHRMFSGKCMNDEFVSDAVIGGSTAKWHVSCIPEIDPECDPAYCTYIYDIDNKNTVTEIFTADDHASEPTSVYEVGGNIFTLTTCDYSPAFRAAGRPVRIYADDDICKHKYITFVDYHKQSAYHLNEKKAGKIGEQLPGQNYHHDRDNEILRLAPIGDIVYAISEPNFQQTINVTDYRIGYDIIASAQFGPFGCDAVCHLNDNSIAIVMRHVLIREKRVVANVIDIDVFDSRNMRKKKVMRKENIDNAFSNDLCFAILD